jgi:hypothetical protein
VLPFLAEREIEDATQRQRREADDHPGLAVKTADLPSGAGFPSAPLVACSRYRLAGKAGTPAALSPRTNPEGIAGVLAAAVAPVAEDQVYW